MSTPNSDGLFCEFDDALTPIVISDNGGIVLYKNKLFSELSSIRKGISLTKLFSSDTAAKDFLLAEKVSFPFVFTANFSEGELPVIVIEKQFNKDAYLLGMVINPISIGMTDSGAGAMFLHEVTPLIKQALSGDFLEGYADKDEKDFIKRNIVRLKKLEMLLYTAYRQKQPLVEVNIPAVNINSIVKAVLDSAHDCFEKFGCSVSFVGKQLPSAKLRDVRVFYTLLLTLVFCSLKCSQSMYATVELLHNYDNGYTLSVKSQTNLRSDAILQLFSGDFELVAKYASLLGARLSFDFDNGFSVSADFDHCLSVTYGGTFYSPESESVTENEVKRVCKDYALLVSTVGLSFVGE